MANEMSRRETPLLDMMFTDIIWIVVFNIVLFSGCIGATLGFTYLDELATVGMAAATAAKLIRDWGAGELYVRPSGIVAALALVLLVLIGLYGGALSGVQDSERAILIDVLTCVKFPLMLLCSLYMLRRASRDLMRVIERECKVVVAALLLLAVANVFLDFGMGAEPRLGIRAFQFLCGHPTGLVALGVSLVLVLLRDPERNRAWILLGLLLIASSLRSKGLVFCALTVTLLVVMRRGRKLNALHGLLCAVLAVIIGWDQFAVSFMTEGYARTELTKASLEIAADHFPLGTGFATFGSSVTADAAYYSQLYFDYGLATVWGLEPGHTNFLSDTFWPTVVGQFGVLGTITFLVLVGALFKLAYDSAGGRRIALVCCFAYLLISSTAESAFFHPMAVPLALCLALVVGDTDGAGAPDATGGDAT